MKNSYIIAACAALSATILSGCSKKAEFIGTWQSIAPTDITTLLPSAARGSATTTLTFTLDDTGKGGDVEATSLIEASQGVESGVAISEGYEVSVAATSTVKGKWIYAPDEDDDILVTFTPNTLIVNVDPDGVTFRQNVITEAQQPVTDSLATATATIWQNEIASAMQKEYGRLSRIDDIKVKDKTTLKFEVENPEQDLYFRRIE